jgi:hypothetical protein
MFYKILSHVDCFIPSGINKVLYGKGGSPSSTSGRTSASSDLPSFKEQWFLFLSSFKINYMEVTQSSPYNFLLATSLLPRMSGERRPISPKIDGEFHILKQSALLEIMV